MIVEDCAIASGSTAITSVTSIAAPPRARSNKKLRHESVILLFCAKFVTVAHKQILFFNVFLPTFVSEKRDGNLNTI